MSTVEESRYFSKKELMCKCGCGLSMMDKHFMQNLDILKEIYIDPIMLKEAYKCRRVKNILNIIGHTDGKAVKVLVCGENAYNLLGRALEMKCFNAIGINQKGARGSRFIHLQIRDNLDSSPYIWTY